MTGGERKFSGSTENGTSTTRSNEFGGSAIAFDDDEAIARSALEPATHANLQFILPRGWRHRALKRHGVTKAAVEADEIERGARELDHHVQVAHEEGWLRTIKLKHVRDHGTTLHDDVTIILVEKNVRRRCTQHERLLLRNLFGWVVARAQNDKRTCSQ
jgi:hypothetical protein